MPIIFFVIAAVVIILLLATYASYLLLQLKRQKIAQRRERQLALEKRNGNIFENVAHLCVIGLQKQCDLSEIVIRICGMMAYLQEDAHIDIECEYPAIFELHQIVKEMARADERLKLPKQQRMQQNLIRHKAESRLNDAIFAELQQLKERVAKSNNQIPIQIL